MNISHLSQETLTQLVELAIAASPTKAAYILLNNETVVSSTAATVVEEKPESYYVAHLVKERRESFSKIIQAVLNRDKVCAIRELRTVSGIGLKEAKDTVERAFTDWFTNIGDMGSADDYWVRALVHFFETKEVILN